MSIEEKAAVAVDSLTDAEALEMYKLFGFEPEPLPAEQIQRIYGGYASSNFRVTGRRQGGTAAQTLLLKINHYGLTAEDAEHQLYVMGHLKTCGFPTNYPHAASSGARFVELGGRRAMLLDFIGGSVPGDKLLASEGAQIGKIFQELGATLASLHRVEWLAWPEPYAIRHVRSAGYPVCNTGDFLRGDDLEALERDERFKEHPFVSFLRRELEWMRELYARRLPEGLIHGDAFLDNTLYDPGSCRLLALVDWEDSCVGPYALDLAVCASATCFTAGNEFMTDRFEELLVGYSGQRQLSGAERASFVDFMRAGALACAFYRFSEFNVRQPGSNLEARNSYCTHRDRAHVLDAPGLRRTIETALAEHETGCGRGGRGGGTGP